MPTGDKRKYKGVSITLSPHVLDMIEDLMPLIGHRYRSGAIEYCVLDVCEQHGIVPPAHRRKSKARKRSCT